MATSENHQRILRREGTISLQEHWEALEAANEKFQAERDRRYTEVSQEREKALKIKEEADKAALGLAREIQIYKDEKANQLREQIGSERGSYATKDDLAAAMREINASIQPLAAYVTSMGGARQQIEQRQDSMRGTTGVIMVTIAIFALFVSITIPLLLHFVK
jgi:aminopeptidase N